MIKVRIIGQDDRNLAVVDAVTGKLVAEFPEVFDGRGKVAEWLDVHRDKARLAKGELTRRCWLQSVVPALQEFGEVEAPEPEWMGEGAQVQCFAETEGGRCTSCNRRAQTMLVFGPREHAMKVKLCDRCRLTVTRTLLNVAMVRELNSE